MIAALYVKSGGAYYGLEGVDPWDELRDARLYDDHARPLRYTRPMIEGGKQRYHRDSVLALAAIAALVVAIVALVLWLV